MTSQFRYLFLYGESKKKVVLELEGHGATKDNLVAKAQELFNLEGLMLQTWDRGFEEWVDLDDDEVVDTNAKILIKGTASELESSTASSVSSLDDISPARRSNVPGSPSTTDMDTDHLPGPDMSSSPAVPASVPGPSRQPSSASVISPKTSTASTGATPTSSNWHLSYRLPTLPSALEKKITTGQQPLKEPERSAILEAIYNSVKVHSYYPKTGQYDYIVKQLLDKYPRLVSLEDMSCADAMSLWKYRLKYKFGNLRKRDDCDIPVVKARKRKNAAVPATNPMKKAVPQWGMANYLPERQPSEDDASIKHHIQWMQLEANKKKPNYQRVEDSLWMTLADRRQMIVSKGATTAEIQEVYPWLFKEDELLNEFRRIEGTATMMSLLEKGLKKYAEPIIQYAKSKNKSAALKEGLRGISTQTGDKAKKEALQKAAVLLVPQLLGERAEHMVCDDQTDTTQLPVYMKRLEELEEEEYEVIVDGITVATAEGFLLAFANYLSSFYCLNLQYTTTLAKTLQFFQTVILGIKDTSSKGKQVMRLQAQISKYLPAQE